MRRKSGPTHRGGKPGWSGFAGGIERTARAEAGRIFGAPSLPALNTIILDPDRKAAFQVDYFVPIISQVLDPGIIYVKAGSLYKTLKYLLENAKKRPGEIRAATAGIPGDDQLVILMAEEAARVKFRIVHFDGAAPMLTAAPINGKDFYLIQFLRAAIASISTFASRGNRLT